MAQQYCKLIVCTKLSIPHPVQYRKRIMKERVRKEKREETSTPIRTPCGLLCASGVLSTSLEVQDQDPKISTKEASVNGQAGGWDLSQSSAGAMLLCPHSRYPKTTEELIPYVKYIRVIITSSRARSPTIPIAAGQRESLQSRGSGFLLWLH